jgi:hypothetical protein
MADTRHPAQVIFREEQRFTQPWLWILLLGGLAAAVGTSLPLVVKFQHRPWPPGLWLPLVFPAAFMLLIVALFAFTRLVTEVGTDGIAAAFRPLQTKPRYISYSDIAEFRAVTYRPIMEYGGWGIKKGRNGLAYNVSGNRGLLLTLSNGRTFLVGSQQPERLRAAVDSAVGNRPFG